MHSMDADDQSDQKHNDINHESSLAGHNHGRLGPSNGVNMRATLSPLTIAKPMSSPPIGNTINSNSITNMITSPSIASSPSSPTNNGNKSNSLSLSNSFTSTHHHPVHHGPGRRRLSDKTLTSINGASDSLLSTGNNSSNNGLFFPDSPARRRIAERNNLDITEGKYKQDLIE